MISEQARSQLRWISHMELVYQNGIHSTDELIQQPVQLWCSPDLVVISTRWYTSHEICVQIISDCNGEKLLQSVNKNQRCRKSKSGLICLVERVEPFLVNETYTRDSWYFKNHRMFNDMYSHFVSWLHCKVSSALSGNHIFWRTAECYAVYISKVNSSLVYRIVVTVNILTDKCIATFHADTAANSTCISLSRRKSMCSCCCCW